MVHTVSNNYYTINIEMFKTGMKLAGGFFGEIKLLEAPIFNMRIKDVEADGNFHISSDGRWKNVQLFDSGHEIELYFENPDDIADISVFINAKLNEKGIIWTAEVINNNQNMSVMEITYPTPIMSSEFLNYFIPMHSGRVLVDCGNRKYSDEGCYPGGKINMQYFAVYGKQNGIYIGFEDSKAASKRFKFSCGDDECKLNAEFFGIGAGLPANSFKAYGKCNWQFFEGDWYDAAMLYSDFVHREAEWLPEIGEKGRKDLAERFKKVPFWICDYIPNSPSQGDNKPMNLSAGSDIYDKDYWYKAPVELQKELGVPIAYHVYNWHEIPFNIEYPHFLPAKKEFKEHIRELQENDIYVLPYINAVGWEIHDAEAGHEINFENTGFKGASVKEDRSFITEEYPQKTASGKTCKLANACGSFAQWHKMIEELSREIEENIGTDGIYFDQVSAVAANPCYSREHNHLPGGGNYWVEGYSRMMKKINANKPKDSFYFSECNSEAFIKSFDGFLTWMWVCSDEVPAYPAVYSGYIQMLGRCTIGNKKDDFEFFKYCTAKSLLYGQQLGWCKADIIYSPERMEFLKRTVAVRYKYTDLFNCSKMLRPPLVKCDLPKIVTKAGLWFDGNIVSEQVLSGAWQYRNGAKTVIFLISISENTAHYSISFNYREYGIKATDIPADYKTDNGYICIDGKLEPYEIKVWEISGDKI